MKLKDNAALVTGGSSGIGAEVCLQLAAEGANVGVVASEIGFGELAARLKRLWEILRNLDRW